MLDRRKCWGRGGGGTEMVSREEWEGECELCGRARQMAMGRGAVRLVRVALTGASV